MVCSSLLPLNKQQATLHPPHPPEKRSSRLYYYYFLTPTPPPSPPLLFFLNPHSIFYIHCTYLYNLLHYEGINDLLNYFYFDQKKNIYLLHNEVLGFWNGIEEKIREVWQQQQQSSSSSSSSSSSERYKEITLYDNMDVLKSDIVKKIGGAEAGVGGLFQYPVGELFHTEKYQGFHYQNKDRTVSSDAPRTSAKGRDSETLFLFLFIYVVLSLLLYSL